MTEQEIQEIVDRVLEAISTNSKTIEQLTPTTTLVDSDCLEVSGGKKVAFSKLKELVASAVVVTAESIKGWIIIDSTADLPEDPTPEEQERAYIHVSTSTLYVYVGTGGDTLTGLYQSVNMKGADGQPGEPGPKGDSGVDLGQIALSQETGQGEDVVMSQKAVTNLVKIYDNLVLSPDFADKTKWESNKMTAVSVNGGIATITYDNNKTTFFQRVPYERGMDVLYHIEAFRNNTGTNVNYAPSVCVSLYDDTGLISHLVSINIAHYLYDWGNITDKISATDIEAEETAKGKTAKYVAIGVQYVGSYFAQGVAMIQNPKLMLTDDENIDFDYIGVLANTSASAMSVKGIDKGKVASYDKSLDAVNFDDISKSYIKSLSLASAGVSRYTLTGDTIKQTSSSGTNLIVLAGELQNVTINDEVFVAVKLTVAGSNGDITMLPTARCDNQGITPTTSNNIVINSDGEHIVGLHIRFDNDFKAGQKAILANTEYTIFPAIETTGMVLNTTTLTIGEVRVYRNPEWIGNGTPNDLASWLYGVGSKVNDVVKQSYNAMYSEVAKFAMGITGITPIFKGKKLITIGDSITFQYTWQPHVAAHLGMKIYQNEICNGTHFVNIEDGSLFDYGLHYDYDKNCLVDNSGVRYRIQVGAGSGAPINIRRTDDNSVYNLPLTPQRTSYPKYYTDSQGNKYLPSVLAYGGQPMRVTGDANLSMYEMSHFAKLYNPDVVILSGGTNDGTSQYGTAEDPICELTLAECQGTITNVTVCSALKGAIKRIMTDCPNTLIFVAMPVRSGRLDGTKSARNNLMEQYKKIAYDMGCGFIDWNSNTGITDYNLDACFKDGIHPNEYGGWLMARKAICDMLG